MDNLDGLIRALIGGVFVAFGIFTILRRSMEIGFGGSRSGTSPLFTVKITGRGAVFLGVTQVVGGAISGLSFIFSWLGNLLSSDFFFSVPSIGILIIVIGIFISPLLSTDRPDIQIFDKRERPFLKTDDTNDVMIESPNIADSNNKEI